MKITVQGATGAGLTQSQANSLGAMVADADFTPGSQDPSNSFMHAMAAPGQSTSEAQNSFNEFVNNNMNSGTANGLAAALHAIQDSYAGGHSGFQPFDGFLNSSMLSHMFNDAFPSDDAFYAAQIATQNAITFWLENNSCR